MFKKFSLIALIIVFMFTQSGCALIQAPFTILGEILKIVNKLPKPPPGVFFYKEQENEE